MPRSTYAIKVHDVSQFDAHVVSLAQPVGLSQDIGVRSTSAVETGRVNKVDFGFHIVIALVSGDCTRTYTQLECTQWIQKECAPANPCNIPVSLA
jgi:hypothetical protein